MIFTIGVILGVVNLLLYFTLFAYAIKHAGEEQDNERH